MNQPRHPTEYPPEETPAKPGLIERLQTQRESHRERSRVVRGLYIAVGFTVLLGGLAMLITPGPAFVVIPIGLALLSLEFVWAERLLDRAIEEGEKAKKKAVETTTTQRILSGIAGALAVAGLVVWAIYGDIPLVPWE